MRSPAALITAASCRTPSELPAGTSPRIGLTRCGRRAAARRSATPRCASRRAYSSAAAGACTFSRSMPCCRMCNMVATFSPTLASSNVQDPLIVAQLRDIPHDQLVDVRGDLPGARNKRFRDLRDAVRDGLTRPVHRRIVRRQRAFVSPASPVLPWTRGNRVLRA